MFKIKSTIKLNLKNKFLMMLDNTAGYVLDFLIPLIIFYFLHFLEVPIFTDNVVVSRDSKFDAILNASRYNRINKKRICSKLRDPQYRKDHGFIRISTKKPPGFLYRMFRVFIISVCLCLIHFFYTTFF